MATNNAVNVPLSGATGTGTFVGSTSPTLVTPQLGVATFTSLKPSVDGGAINDNSGFTVATIVTGGGTPVNYLQLSNAVTTAFPALTAQGTDTNISLNLIGKGTGGVRIQGNTAGGNATAGYVGEFISSVIPIGSAVSLTTGIAANTTSISLTAGDWDVWGNEFFSVTGATTAITAWTSATSATNPSQELKNQIQTPTVSSSGISAPFARYSLSATTTIYLGAFSLFTTGTVTVCGGIYARRVR